MLLVEQLRCESWNPPLNCEEWNTPPHCFPPGQVTKLFAGERLLSNALELVKWLKPVVYPILCDDCWEEKCCAGDLARIVRTGQHLLWLPPRDEDLGPVGYTRHHSVIPESMLIPIAAWDRMRQQTPRLPSAESFPQATRRDIGLAWLQEMPEALRPDDLPGLVNVVKSALHSNPLPLDLALAGLKRRLEWLSQAPGETVACQIAPWAGAGHAVNTLYFDGPPFLEWPVFAAADGLDFCLGPQWRLTVA